MFERREALSQEGQSVLPARRRQFWLARKDGRRRRPHQRPDRPSRQDRPGRAGRLLRHDRRRERSGDLRGLFKTAEDWLRERGRGRRSSGPFNLSINEEVGLLIDGFDTRRCS
jgi:hypothetical protein